jgi:Sec-independent protein secretion pathway component TatC
LLLAVPLCLLYEVGIWAARLVTPAPDAQAAADAK